jgi:hypothetical protein
MLEYDPILERVLIAFRGGLGLCSLRSKNGNDISEPTIYSFDSEVGGIGFVASGARCLATQPQESSMLVMFPNHLWITQLYFSVVFVLHNDILSLESKISVPYIPFVRLTHCYLAHISIPFRHYVSVSENTMIYAVGGWDEIDSHIHVYEWRLQGSPVEKVVVIYPRLFISPRSITFSFLKESHFLVIGGEDEVVEVYNLVDNHKVATLKHQGRSLAGSFRAIYADII